MHSAKPANPGGRAVRQELIDLPRRLDDQTPRVSPELQRICAARYPDAAVQANDESSFMRDGIRIRELLQEVLDSGRTPEEVCAECPEFLPVIRKRLRQFRHVEHGLEALFPSSVPGGAGTPPPDQHKDILPLIADKPILVQPVGSLKRVAMWVRRRPAAAALVVLLLVFLGAIFVASVWLRQQEKVRRNEKSLREGRMQQADVGYHISDKSVGNVFKAHGIEPAPDRQQQTTWATFLKAHWDVLTKSEALPDRSSVGSGAGD